MYRLCQAYQALPEVGGVLDQPVSVLRMHAILEAGGYFDQHEAVPTSEPPDVFAGIKTVAL